MSRGSLPNSFAPWGFRQERRWVISGPACTLTGHISRACGSSWRFRKRNNRVSLLRMRREGSRFSRCFMPLGLERALTGMPLPRIPRTAGARFQERIILSGSSRGLSRRQRRSEEFAWSEIKEAMTTNQQTTRVRCAWAKNELNITYHDEEWGVPVHDEHKWLELLILEGAQAGLGWDTILEKRARNREGFEGFDPEKGARVDNKKVVGPLAECSTIIW